MSVGKDNQTAKSETSWKPNSNRRSAHDFVRDGRYRDLDDGIEQTNHPSLIHSANSPYTDTHREFRGSHGRPISVKLSSTESVQNAVFGALIDPVWARDTSGNVLSANQAAASAFGLQPDVMIGLPVKQLVDKDRARSIAASDAQVIKSRRETIIEVEHGLGNSDRVYRIRRLPIFDEDNAVIGVLDMATDVTEQYRHQQRWHDEKRRHALALQAVSGVVYEHDIDTGHVNRSEGLYELIGYQPIEAEPTVEWWTQRIHPADFAEATTRTRRQITAGAGRIDTEYRVQHRAGHWVHVWDRAMAVRDNGELRFLVGNIIDITVHKQDEAALREREERLAMVLMAAGMSSWTIDIRRRQFLPSAPMRELFALPQAAEQALHHSFRATLALWRNRLHPDDRAMFNQALRRAMRQDAPADLEYRIVLPDQQIRWIASHAIVLRDEAGRASHLYGVVADITARKQFEQQLANNAREIRTITDAAPIGIIRCDRERRLLFANQTYAEWFLPMPVDAVVGQPFASLCSADEWALVAPYIDRVLRGELAQQEYQSHSHTDGWRDLHVSYVPERDADDQVTGWVSVISDMTERKRTGRLLYQREREFKAIIESSPEVIARFDRRSTVLYVNSAVSAELAKQPEELIGRPLQQAGIQAEASKALIDVSAAVFATGDEQRAEFSSDMSGERRHYVVRAMPEFDTQQNVESALLIIYNVTERVRFDRERSFLLESEQAARAHAEAAAQAREQFLSIISHELRSPLSAIVMWAHVLETKLGEQAAPVQRAIAGIKSGVGQQVRLIENLLDATRLMSGTLSIQREPVLVAPILQQSIAEIRGAAQAKQIDLQVHNELTDQQVEGDSSRIAQIFSSLLSNAVKFTPDYGKVLVRTWSIDGLINIEIADTGKGISSEFLPQIFEWFRQADAAASRRQEGLGLDLALVRQLCELHGGRIAVASDGIDQGATFIVSLPRLGNAVSAVAKSTAIQLTGVPSLTGRSVLLIDDKAEALEALSEVLEHAGAAVHAVGSGIAAIDWLRSIHSGQRAPVDAVLCDIAMPQQDGYATLKQLRGLEQSLGVKPEWRMPVIALTAFAHHTDKVRALHSGFTMHLTKPVVPDQLITAIDAVVKEGNESTAR